MFLCIQLKFVMHLADNHFLDKFDNAEEKKWIKVYQNKMNNLKSFSCILPKFVLHITNNQFSDKLNDGWNFCLNGRFIVIFCILCQ